MAALAGLVFLAGILASLTGPICLFAPNMLRLNSRWYALPLSTLFLAAAGIGMMIDPTGGQAGADSSAASAGVIALLLWAGIAYAAHRMAKTNRTANPAQPEGLVANPPASAASASSGAKQAVRSLSERAKARLSEVQASTERALGAAQAERQRVKAQKDEASRMKALGVDGRLQLYYERLQAREIDLDSYAEEIDAEDDALTERREQLNANRKYHDPEFFEMELEQFEEDEEAIRWRREWIDKQRYTASISRPDLPDSGKWARFEYVDNDGVMTKRTIAMWERRGGYIVGYDRAKKAERTFRQDRISSWVCG